MAQTAQRGLDRRLARRWGRVSAKPSEYLIKLRRGKVVAHGSGLSVWLWPGQTCTILPTSIQRTSFVADQITSEKVGVAVTGIAVYRISDPLLAFRMLDFSDGPAAVEQLSIILREMFVGAARRLVANMTVQECLTRRKESIAQELMREILPVVSGAGRPEDTTDQGWGVVIDTIEIQDVRILSEKVFSDLQAPFRARLELQSRTSAVERDQEVHLREVAARQEMLRVDQALSRQQSEAEERSRLEALAAEERVQLAQSQTEERMAQARLAAELAGRERARSLADAEHELSRHTSGQEAELSRQRALSEAELARQQAQQQAELERLGLEARLALEEDEAAGAARVARQQVETERLRGELRLQLERQTRELENLFTDERLRYEFVTCALPAVAEAFAKNLGQVHLTRFVSGREDGGGAGPLAETVAQLLAVARASGLDLARVLTGTRPGDSND
jgi:flotillin